MVKKDVFQEEVAREQIKERFDKVIEAQNEWFKRIEETRALQKEWPDVDSMIPRLKELNEEERAEFDSVMRMRQNIDGAIVYSLRQALIRYGNLLFI